MPALARPAALQRPIANAPERLRALHAQQDTVGATTALEQLREASAHLEADKALRICRGLDMARHADEWRLFLRTLPFLESEVGITLKRLNDNEQTSATNRAGKTCPSAMRGFQPMRSRQATLAPAAARRWPSWRAPLCLTLNPFRTRSNLGITLFDFKAINDPTGIGSAQASVARRSTLRTLLRALIH